MNSSESHLEPAQRRWVTHFEKMGLSARPMPDGRALLVSLRLSSEPVESVGAPIQSRRVVFSTVGATHIKCLRPRAFFGLPLLDIRGCKDPEAIETRIRDAWREHTRSLVKAHADLRARGLDVAAVEENSALAFSLPGDLPSVQVLVKGPEGVILPSVGPLSGLPLDDPSDRVLDMSDCPDGASELEVHLGQRIHELETRHRQTLERNRIGEPKETPCESGPPPKAQPGTLAHRPRILLVGPTLVTNRVLLDELTRQGFRPALSPSESAALQQLDTMTPEVVLSEYSLGRSDGASFIQAMGELPGIERVPVVLLDAAWHENRRAIARAVGASGYLTTPTETGSFVARIGRLVLEPGDRRFTRYAQRLAASLEDEAQGCVVTELSRGGVFVATPRLLDSQTTMRGKVALPEVRKTILFEGEVRYCSESHGTSRQGIGLRFFDMSPADEGALIDYLSRIDDRVGG